MDFLDSLAQLGTAFLIVMAILLFGILYGVTINKTIDEPDEFFSKDDSPWQKMKNSLKTLIDR